jgi:TetR/AcrR family acrAB operon transcriptional repressor
MTRENRLMLLNAAADLFAEKGFRRTTFEDVAERAGISRGSIPWHFGTKDGLMLAVLDHESDLLLADLRGAEEMDAAAVSDHLIELARDGTLRRVSRLFIALYVEALTPDSPIREAFADIHDKIRANLASWAGRVLDLPTDVTADDAAVLLFGAGLGVDMQWLITPDRIDQDRAFLAMRSLLRPVTRRQE